MITKQYAPSRYQGDDVQTSFPVLFDYVDTADIRVTRTVDDVDTILDADNADFTVSEGNVILPDPLEVGEKLTLWLEMPLLQKVDLKNTGKLDLEVLEQALDAASLGLQQLNDSSERSIKVPVTSETTPEEFTEEIFTARDEALFARDEAELAAINVTGNTYRYTVIDEAGEQVFALPFKVNAEVQNFQFFVDGDLVADAFACDSGGTELTSGTATYINAGYLVPLNAEVKIYSTSTTAVGDVGVIRDEAVAARDAATGEKNLAIAAKNAAVEAKDDTEALNDSFNSELQTIYRPTNLPVFGGMKVGPGVDVNSEALDKSPLHSSDLHNYLKAGFWDYDTGFANEPGFPGALFVYYDGGTGRVGHLAFGTTGAFLSHNYSNDSGATWDGWANVLFDNEAGAEFIDRCLQIGNNNAAYFTRYDSSTTFTASKSGRIKVLVRGTGGAGGINDVAAGTTPGTTSFAASTDNEISATGGNGGSETTAGTGGTGFTGTGILHGLTATGATGEDDGDALPAGDGGGDGGGAGATTTNSSGGDGVDGGGGGGGCGGGSSSDASAGGGEGGWAEGWLDVTKGQQFAIVIGAQGTQPTYGGHVGGAGGLGYVMVAEV